MNQFKIVLTNYSNHLFLDTQIVHQSLLELMLEIVHQSLLELMLEIGLGKFLITFKLPLLMAYAICIMHT